MDARLPGTNPLISPARPWPPVPAPALRCRRRRTGDRDRRCCKNKWWHHRAIYWAAEL